MKINDDLLDHLFALSRIESERDPKKREKLKKDLSKILDYFKELESVDTTNIEPLFGGSFLTNVYRKDENQNLSPEEKARIRENCVNNFPVKEHGYLRVPPIFE